MSEQHKALIRRVVEEVYNGGKLDAVDELVSSDFMIHAGAHDIRGAGEARQYVTSLHEAFPDIHFTIDDQFADGDRVATRWTARGTHSGMFQGIPPTGKEIRMTAIDIDRVANGKIVECWTSVDELGLLQQLGAVPEPAPAG
jgi:steroid delta-isomerase-like uncharacterized protein